jgi:hypothetical protein
MTISGRTDAGVPRDVRIDDRGNPKTLPDPLVEARRFPDGGNGLYTFAVPAAPGAVFELPDPNDEYILISNGTTVYCRMGGAGTVATIAVGGYDFPLGDGIWAPKMYYGCSHIAYVAVAANAGNITFLHIRTP